MKLRDLFVSIGFDVDDKALTRLDQGLRKTKTLIFAVGAAATASAGLLYGMAKSVADTGDKAAKTADKLGVQIEALQELRYAAELSGIAQTNFDTGLQRMTRRAAEAAQGTGVAKDAFKELGVQLTDTQGRVRRSEELLADIADGMAAIEDPSRRVALAFKLFDTEGVGMVNMLRSGGAALRSMREEARQLGFVIGEEDARNAEAFNDNLTRTRLIITGIRNEVGARLLPIFSDLMVRFKQWVGYNRDIIKSGVEKALRAMIVLMRWLYTAGRTVVSVLSGIAEMFGGIERAARIAAWAVGLFAGAQVLSAIGSLAMGIGQLTGAFKLMGNAALLANAKAAAIPVLIGAAVAALIVIWQDIIYFFQGKDSLLGTLVAAFEERFPRLFETLQTVFSIIMELVSGHWIVSAKNAIEPFVSWLEDKFAPIIEAMKTMRSFRSRIDSAMYSAADALGLGVSGDHVRYYKVPKTNNVNVNAPINVNVPEGTPPAEVGRAVQNGVSDGISRMLRQTAEQTEPVDLW